MVKRNKDNHNHSNQDITIIAVVGTLILMISGIALFYNYIQEKKIIAFDYMSERINPIFVEQSTEEEIPDIKAEVVEETITNDTISSLSNDYEYLGYLEIPKISLRKGFLDKTSSDNDVDRNIFVVSVSDYPDVENGNFIIAAHSGTGYKAFFKNLYQLKIGDDSYVTYQGVRYHYQITKIYQQKKTGKIAIYRNYDKTTMTLVTCTKDDDFHQTVYILELIEKTST